MMGWFKKKPVTVQAIELERVEALEKRLPFTFEKMKENPAALLKGILRAYEIGKEDLLGDLQPLRGVLKLSSIVGQGEPWQALFEVYRAGETEAVSVSTGQIGQMNDLLDLWKHWQSDNMRAYKRPITNVSIWIR